MKIRKQVYELTSKDLDEYPAWEFALKDRFNPGFDREWGKRDFR